MAGMANGVVFQGKAAHEPPTNALQLAELVTSPLTGIVRRINELPPTGQHTHHRSATPANYGVLPGGGAISTSGGSGATSAEALERTIFEAIERYCAAIVDEAQLTHGMPERGCLYGNALPLFADFQYRTHGWPFVPLNERSDVCWVEGTSLRSGAAVKVPAAVVHVPYHPCKPDECIGPAMWMNRLQGPLVLPTPGSALAADVARLAGCGELTLVNISNDLGVPTIVAVLRSTSFGKRTVTVGAACHPRAEAACRKAALEAVSEYERQRTWAADPVRSKWRPNEDFSNVVDFEWHGLVYAFEEWQAHLEFMTASALRQDIADVESIPGDGAELLAELLHRSKNQLSDVVAIDLTTPEIAELGVHVTKVIVPEAVPLAPDHRFPWLGHQRLYDVPVALGLADEPATATQLNPMPHPFA